MTLIEVRTEINATPAEVYDVLMDFPSYPEWNPMVIKISGTPTVDSIIEAHIKIGERSPQVFKPTILANDKDKELRWVGKLFFAFLFRGEHYFQIESTDTGCTFIHGEHFSGLLEPLIFKTVGSDFEPAYKGFNDALKARVEGSK